MKTLVGLVSYCAFVGLLAFGVMAGSGWLLRSDPSTKAHVRARVIPQKILDSIERKKPIPIAVAAPAPIPTPAAPVMQEAPVSLPNVAAPPRSTRAVATARPQKLKKRHATPLVTTVQAPVPSAAVVSTVRTDFPY
jgi:hypothetical protein